jgi:hypothetical protein
VPVAALRPDNTRHAAYASHDQGDRAALPSAPAETLSVARGALECPVHGFCIDAFRGHGDTSFPASRILVFEDGGADLPASKPATRRVEVFPPWLQATGP